jgi:hypothetical protein
LTEKLLGVMTARTPHGTWRFPEPRLLGA